MSSNLPKESSNFPPPAVEPNSFFVVGIGASAGGIPALKQFFSTMPADSGMAFIVVLHLSAEHESHLASILQSETKMPVVQVTEVTTIEPDHVYVNPPAQHLTVHERTITPVELEPTRGRRVPIDLLFRTLGDECREKAICIILSGTGADGTLGLKRIKESGGIAIVQDPAEAEFSEMPRSAIATNHADIILPIAEMPARLLALRERSSSIDAGHDGEAPSATDETDESTFRSILSLLRTRTGHDFSGYKRATIMRRIARRRSVHDLETVQEYLTYLRSNAEEFEFLLRDFLISVTNFFRDPEAFDELRRTVLPRMFEGKGSDDVIRVWSVGCATGEEAYSLAIMLNEYADALVDPPRIQVFATDIDAEALRVGREGRYNDTIAVDVSPEQLQRFFTTDGSDYRVKKSLRESVLFAQHNILRDPPFSQLDLVSCRNLLIYLDRDAQQYVYRIIHFGLRRSGYLMLGTSESADSQLYTPLSAKNHLFKAKHSEAGVYLMPDMPHYGDRRTVAPALVQSHSDDSLSYGNIHHRLVEKYAPPSVLVNEEFEVVHVSENGGRYLKFGGGVVSREVLKLVHPALREHLRDALLAAKHDKRDSETRGLTLNVDGADVTVNMTVRPCEPIGPGGCFYLLMFDDSCEAPPTEAPVASNEVSESNVKRLEDELRDAREIMRKRGEQSEISDQGLRSSNEELQSIIEELRSASEELETSKEELQSVNEELSTVNHELKNKIDEVSIANADLHNLLSSTEIATVFLDRNLLIRRFTPLATGLINLIAADVGRPIGHLTHRLEYDAFASDAAAVMKTDETREREIAATDGRTFITRLIPYRTLEGKVDGVVVTFIDITERKTAEDAQRWLAEIVNSSNDAIISFSLDGVVVSWNESAERLFGYSPAEILGQPATILSDPQQDDEVRDIFERIRRGESITNFETVRKRKNGEALYASMSVSPITDAAHNPRGVTAIVRDVSERRMVRAELLTLARRKDEFLAMLAHELRNPLAPILSGLEVIRDSEGHPENVEMAVGIIERQTMQLVRLVDDLLDVSRITNGAIRLQKERVDVRSIISMAVETCHGQIEAAHLKYEVSVPKKPVYLDADPARITQVIVNLLSNAAKYTEADGHVWLSVEPVDGMISISVRDSGIGIPKEMLGSIFDIFTQIDTGRRHARGGLGIGLSVVKTLVEMHGGGVEVSSEGEGKGSEFIVRLPLAADQDSVPIAKEPEERKDEPGSNGISVPKRILVVDDNVDAAAMLSELLVKEKHDVRVAVNGTSAVKEALAFHPDVCLLDIGLPDFDGYEVARQVRAQLPDTMLIALTGWGQEEDRTRSRDAGFDHHVVKPIDWATLRKLIINGRIAVQQ